MRATIAACAIAFAAAAGLPSAASAVTDSSPIARWTCAAQGLDCDPCPVHCSSPTGSVAPGVSVGFDGRVSSDDRVGAVPGHVVGWEWTFCSEPDCSSGYHATASGAVVAHTFPTADTYYVTLKAIDNDGLFDTKQLHIAVSGTASPPPPPPVSPPPATPPPPVSTPPPPPPSGGYAARVLATPGLLSYWRLNEKTGTSAADSKGGRTGTYLSGVTLGAAGALTETANKAATFDGVNDEVKLPALPSAANFTIEGWQHLAAGAPANNTLFGSATTVRLLTRPAGYYVLVMVGKAAYIVQGTTPTNTNVWVHWALVRQGASYTLYRNGVKVVTKTGLPATTATSLSGSIGRSTSAYPAKGGIDEVAVYNAALSATVVQQHFASR